jgi:F0F1-type ATP synthase assembly protein I
MKLLNTSTRVSSDDQVGRGMDAALLMGLFLGLGYLLDRWLGTSPVFMIVLVLLGAIGVFLKLKYRYEATMRGHEEALAARRAGDGRRPGA